MARTNKQRLINLHSAEEKQPIGLLQLGEIAVQHSVAEGSQRIYIETASENASAATLVEFVPKAYIDGLNGAMDTRVKALETTVGDAESGLVKKVADLEAAVGEGGSVEAQITAAIKKLDATQGAAEVAEGTHVAVQVVQENGVITGVTVKESDIASAAGLQTVVDSLAETGTVGAKIKANTDAIATLNGDDKTAGSVAKAVADAKSELTTEINKKVTAEDGKRLMTDAEGTKLAGIAEGAQVNVIETVKVNGEALTVEGKAVNVVIPAATVTGVKSGDKVIALNGTELTSTLTYAREEVEGVDSLVLKGIDGAVLGSVPVADFVADGMLESVTPVEGTTEFLFTFKKGNGTTESFKVDFGKFVDTYHADDETLELDSTTNTFSVKEGVFESAGAAAAVKGEIETALEGYVTKDGDKVLSDNNLTDELVELIDGAVQSVVIAEGCESGAKVATENNVVTFDFSELVIDCGTY